MMRQEDWLEFILKGIKKDIELVQADVNKLIAFRWQVTTGIIIVNIILGFGIQLLIAKF